MPVTSALETFGDSGPGFYQSRKSNLFIPFFTTQPIGSGHIGLGFSIACDILVIEHSGDLSHNRRDDWTEAAAFLSLKPKNRTRAPIMSHRATGFAGFKCGPAHVSTAFAHPHNGKAHLLHRAPARQAGAAPPLLINKVSGSTGNLR